VKWTRATRREEMFTNRYTQIAGLSALGLGALAWYLYSRSTRDDRSSVSNSMNPRASQPSSSRPVTQSTTAHPLRSSSAGASTTSTTTTTTTTTTTPSTSLQRRPVTHQTHFTLSQALRSAHRVAIFRVCCATQSVLFRPDGSVIQDAAAVLKKLAAVCDLYLMHTCDSDAAEATVLSTLDSLELFRAGLQKHKMLFCQTAIGRAHMCRQLEAHVHIDTDWDVLKILKPHIPELYCIAASTSVTARQYSSLHALATALTQPQV